jgi:hypothetical protein
MLRRSNIVDRFAIGSGILRPIESFSFGHAPPIESFRLGHSSGAIELLPIGSF